MRSKLILLLLLLSTSHSLYAQQRHNLIDENMSQFANVYAYGKATVTADGVVELNAPANFFLLTQKRYSNFILEAEVKMPDVTEYSNSGIIFRAQVIGKKGNQQAMGYQAEVDPSDRKWSGGLYDQARRQWLHPLHEIRSNPDEDFKQNLSPQWSEERAKAYKHLAWNKYRIECRDDDIKIYLNGVLTTHVKDSKDAEGHIGLQHHGSEEFKQTGTTINVVRFRNVFITELN
jgi:hypothetical protein